MSEADWDARSEQIRKSGRTLGLTINVDTARLVDSRHAHRLLKLAAARSVEPTWAWDQLYAAHLQENANLQDPATLREVGVRLGLSALDIDQLVAGDELADAVLADHEEARSRGITGVPTLVGGDHVLGGARTVAEIVSFLESAAPGAATQ